jgi:hypothetical protein
VEARLAGRPHQPALYLWSGQHVRLLADGFRQVLADIYWLRTVQYFGSQHAFGQESGYPLLRPLIEITTSLDPRMEIAYRYGATFLAEPPPSGAGDPRAAVEILRKGVESNPRSWRLRQDLALFHYFFLDDAQTASRVLLEASNVPGAPPLLKTLAADVLTRRGDRATARALWQRLYEEAEPGAMKDNAALHLGQLDAFDALDAIRAATRSFRARTGRWPTSLDELRRAGLVRGALRDPVGVPFEYNPETGQVSLSRASPLWRRDLDQVNR